MEALAWYWRMLSWLKVRYIFSQFVHNLKSHHWQMRVTLCVIFAIIYRRKSKQMNN